MIVTMSPQEVELIRRTAYLRRSLHLALAFSRHTSWLLPRVLHMLPLELLSRLFYWHARDL